MPWPNKIAVSTQDTVGPSVRLILLYKERIKSPVSAHRVIVLLQQKQSVRVGPLTCSLRKDAGGPSGVTLCTSESAVDRNPNDIIMDAL